jgi:hypothetical protein
MTQQVLSYPLRIDTTTGRFATVSDETDTYKAQQIRAFTRTVKGERLILTDFGMTDPAFNEFDVSEFVDKFSDYYSVDRIKITSIERNRTEGIYPDIVINFT